MKHVTRSKLISYFMLNVLCFMIFKIRQGKPRLLRYALGMAGRPPCGSLSSYL